MLRLLQVIKVAKAGGQQASAVARPAGNESGRRKGDAGQQHVKGGKATASQVRAIHAIVNRLGLDLLVTLRERFGADYAEDLAISQASQLIKELKTATNGAGGNR